jgi:hypothetical protein
LRAKLGSSCIHHTPLSRGSSLTCVGKSAQSPKHKSLLGPMISKLFRTPRTFCTGSALTSWPRCAVWDGFCDGSGDHRPQSMPQAFPENSAPPKKSGSGRLNTLNSLASELEVAFREGGRVRTPIKAATSSHDIGNLETTRLFLCGARSYERTCSAKSGTSKWGYELGSSSRAERFCLSLTCLVSCIPGHTVRTVQLHNCQYT